MDLIQAIEPGSFDPPQHYYPKVLNAQIHPLIRFLLNFDKERLISRYVHLHPSVDRDALRDVLNYSCKYLKWAGADLFNVTSETGQKRIVVIETNSCPSGQKSMPLSDELIEAGGYHAIMDGAFVPQVLKDARLGGLAVLFDKNKMEASGYAATMADIYKEPVDLVRMSNTSSLSHVRYREGWLEIQKQGQWRKIRAAMRYVTQKPWNRIPVGAKTVVLNPTIACLAGGRNKLMASKAYEILNAELAGTGLRLMTPYTVNDVKKMEVPLALQSLGGRGVVKIPYSNAGQGVFTITTKKELDEFMAMDFIYDQFIVQSLIGNRKWSSVGPEGPFFHVGTVPNKKNQIFVADLRFMVCSGPQGFVPVCLYARRARKPLAEDVPDAVSSWEILGTNLSLPKGPDQWDSDTERLVLMDRKDFNQLGFGLDDLLESFIQTILAVIAIDKMSATLLHPNGTFNRELFGSLNKDDVLMEEILELDERGNFSFS